MANNHYVVWDSLILGVVEFGMWNSETREQPAGIKDKQDTQSSEIIGQYPEELLSDRINRI